VSHTDSLRPSQHRAPDPWRVLRTRHLWVLLISTHLPLTLLFAIVPSALQAGQVVATPLILLISGVILLSFVTGYVGLAKRLRHPGGLYVQVIHGLGRPIGIGVAAVSLVGYLGLGGALFQYFGSTVSGVSAAHGIDIPVWVAIVLGMAAVSGFGFLSLRTGIRILTAIAVGQTIVVAIFLAAAFWQPAGGHVSFDGLNPSYLLTGSFGAALAYSLSAMVGTEIGVTFNNELVTPERSLPRASFLAYGMMAFLVALCALAVSVAGSPEQVTGDAAEAGAPFMATIVARLVGAGSATAAMTVILTGLAIGMLANALILQGAIARQLAGLARDGLLPMALWRDPGRGRVRAGLLLFFPLIAGSVALIARSTSGGLPIWLIVGCGFAVLSTLALASAAAFVWFVKGEDETEEGIFGWEGHMVAAAFAAVTLGFAVVYGITHLSALGNTTPRGANWMVLGLIAVPFTVGAVSALAIKATHPRAFARIGRLGYRSMDFDTPVAPATARVRVRVGADDRR
jgi:amino acid transporter